MIGQTPGETGAEAETARLLRHASDGYGDLPEEVAQRLDRVLQTLPAADTLRGAAAAPARDGFLATLAERLRPKRVRYAIASGAAAVLVTVGAVAVGLQTLAPQGDEAGSAEMYAEDAPRTGEDHDSADGADEGAAPGATEDSLAEEPEQGGTDAEVGVTDVESFASGTDYSGSADLLAALRGLGDHTRAGEVPDELAAVAAGGEFWRACEEAISEEYQSLLVAVDFARYESAPAIMVLLVSEQGEIAVALSPACADGIIEALAVQP
ncbi:hypothetical protein [Glycomyces terrestris]|uniref:Uncharacterized protein n=1 Tax=Glycomyces terrestris TaxID=2493553 RepID=A0A426UYJ4_9ACTN|nr:hypothetical protein [Glycomyces terrestris]RRR99641.1 hypothetical protein EIW28_13220 [Glycomyces terrestris]